LPQTSKSKKYLNTGILSEAGKKGKEIIIKNPMAGKKMIE
jgi:hypothetical protein